MLRLHAIDTPDATSSRLFAAISLSFYRHLDMQRAAAEHYARHY